MIVIIINCKNPKQLVYHLPSMLVAKSLNISYAILCCLFNNFKVEDWSQFEQKRKENGRQSLVANSWLTLVLLFLARFTKSRWFLGARQVNVEKISFLIQFLISYIFYSFSPMKIPVRNGIILIYYFIKPSFNGPI